MLQIDLWRNGSGWKHPMEHYTYRSREPFTEDRGKCMVDPDHLGGFNVRPFCSHMHRLTHLHKSSTLMGDQGKCMVDPDHPSGFSLSCHIPAQICMCGFLPRQSLKRDPYTRATGRSIDSRLPIQMSRLGSPLHLLRYAVVLPCRDC